MGGSSSETSNSYDPVSSMASLYSAMKNQNRSDELFDIYKDYYLPYDQQALAANTSLLNSMTQLTQQEIALNAELNPTRAEATKTALNEAIYDIGDTRALRGELRDQQEKELKDSSGVAEKFYKTALEGITPQYEQRMGEAAADVAQSYKNANQQTVMDMARLGVDPTSGKALSALSGSSLSQARDTASARTQARNTERTRVEDTGWDRLTTAMNARQHATSGQWSPDYGSVAAGGTPYMSGTTNFTTSGSNPLGSSSQYAGLSSNALSQLASRVQSTETSSNDGGSGIASAGAAVLGAVIGKYSSARFKDDIRPVTDVAVYAAVNPVGYVYKSDPAKLRRLGFIAEELAETLPEVVFFDEGRPVAVDYGKLAVMLCLENRRLAERLAELEGRN